MALWDSIKDRIVMNFDSYNNSTAALKKDGSVKSLRDLSKNRFLLDGTSLPYENSVLFPSEFNSKKSLYFDGTDTYLYSMYAKYAATNSFSCFLVTKPENSISIHAQSTSGTVGTTGTNSYILGQEDDSDTNNSFLAASVGTNGLCVMGWRSSYAPCLLSHNAVIDDTSVIEIAFNNKASSFYLDGTFMKNGETSSLNIIAPSVIGGTGYGGYLGHFHEMLIIEGVLTAGERELVEGYLAHKWGTTSRLPVAHAYKDSPPVGFSTTLTFNKNHPEAAIVVCVNRYSDGEPLLCHVVKDLDSFEYIFNPALNDLYYTTCYPDYGTEWKPDTVYAVGDFVHPTNLSQTPYYYKRIVEGSSGATEPIWFTSPGGICDDGVIQSAWKLMSRIRHPITHGPSYSNP